jgi:hypothetical protein
MVERARRLGSNSIKVQWVNGDSKKAEYSFFKINQSATLIDPTELGIIKARHKPNALAARALIRAGTGHKYWSDFPQHVQREIEDVARSVYDILFDPELSIPIKTLDLPVAGIGYTSESVKLIFDFVNFANNIRPDMWMEPEHPRRASKPKEERKPLADDADGSTTLRYLKTVKQISSRISGNNAASLGMHPAVYFYGATGRYQSASFLATVALVQELERGDKFYAFTECRYRFEEFLLSHRYFINQIVVSNGSGTKSLDPVFKMYRIILAAVGEGRDDDQIVSALQSEPRLTYLRVLKEEDREYKRNFSSDTKSAAFLRDALDKAIRCKECNARIHFKSISIDHKQRKQDGGLATVDNAQLTHPYCNTGYKEKRISMVAKAGAERS